MIVIPSVNGVTRSISLLNATKVIDDSGFVWGYDRVVTDEGSVSLLDLAIPAFLDAPPNFSALREGTRDKTGYKTDPATFDGALRLAGKALSNIPRDEDLWTWDRDPSTSKAITDAIQALTTLPSFGVVRAAKLLHRKRPRLLPIFDPAVSATMGWLPTRPADASDYLRRMTWLAAALEEDDASVRDLQHLSQHFVSANPPVLSPLRVLDILAWHLGAGGRYAHLFT